MKLGLVQITLFAVKWRWCLNWIIIYYMFLFVTLGLFFVVSFLSLVAFLILDASISF